MEKKNILNLKYKINLYKIKDSFKCLLIPNHNMTTVTIMILVPCGSRHETESFGIAHFIEHMAFKGTETKSNFELFNLIDELGARCNAFTTFDYTIYYIAGDPRDINKILNFILDLFLNSIYPEEEIIKEKKVVMEEYNLTKNNYFSIMFNRIRRLLYKDVDEGYSRPIIGSKESIQQYTKQDIINFKKKNYDISKCILCISGNFIKKDIKKKN